MRVRVVNALLYLALALFGSATIGQPLRLALVATSSRYSYAPNLAAPWVWLLLALLLTVALADAVRRLALTGKAGLRRYATLLVVIGACLAARKQIGTPSHPVLEEGVAHLIARAEIGADAAFRREKQYPERTDALTAQWSPELRDLGFFRRGAIPLSTRMHVVPHTFGPVLIADIDVRPGDLVFAVSVDGRRYWITAFVLVRGSIVPLVDESGRLVVASAMDGHQTSRLDPLFPEYPNKLPHHDAM